MFLAKKRKFNDGLYILENLIGEIDRGKDKKILADCYESYADICALKGDFQKSHENYNLSISILKLNGFNHDLLNCLHYKSLSYNKEFNLEKNLDYAQKSLRTIRVIEDELFNAMNQSNSDINKLFLIKSSKGYFETAITLNLKLHNLTDSLKYRNEAYRYISKNKAILLYEGIQSRYAINKTLPDSIISKEKALSSSLNNLNKEIANSENTSEKDSLYAKLIITKDQHKTYLKKLETEYPDFYKMKFEPITTLSLEEVQNKLDDNQLLLDYYMAEDSIICFSVSKNKIKYTTAALDDSLKNSLISFRKNIESNIPIDSESHKNIYDILINQNIEGHQNIDHLVIIGDDILHKLPFDALKNNDNYLIEDFAVSYLFSNNQLKEKSTPKNNPSYMGFGTAYSNSLDEKLKENLETRHFNLQNLNFANDEIKNSSRFWNKQVYFDSLSTKENFLKNKNGANIAHLALHGVINHEYPDYSAILFDDREEDNMMHIYDLYQQKLNYDLVILSSCHSADGKLYKGEGIKSMARGFAFAGCPSIVSSQWAAYDKETGEIVANFNKYLSQGLSKAKALQKAKIDYIQTAHPNVNHPQLWANLILIGNTDALVSKGFASSWVMWGMVAVFLLIGFLLYKKNRS